MQSFLYKTNYNLAILIGQKLRCRSPFHFSRGSESSHERNWLGYRSPTTSAASTIALILRVSSTPSLISAARAFSSRREALRHPGMGMSFLRWSPLPVTYRVIAKYSQVGCSERIQARVIWELVALCFFATSNSWSTIFKLWMKFASENRGMARRKSSFSKSSRDRNLWRGQEL
jgi:hypothetical protein